MLEDNDFLEKLNKQSYTSSTQQSSSLTVEDLQRTVNDLKEEYGDNTGLHYLPKSLEEYRMISLLPSRRHEDDVVGTVLEENHWQHLDLPIVIDDPRDANEDYGDIERKATIDWIEENFKDRLSNQTYGPSTQQKQREQEEALYQSMSRKMTHQEIEEGFAKQYGDNKSSVFSAYQGLGIVQSHVHSMIRPIAVSGTDEGFNLEDHIKDTNIATKTSITADDILHLLETLHDEASKEAPMFIVPLKNYKKIKVAYIKSQRPHGVVLRKSVLRRINKRQKQQINKVNKTIKKLEASPIYNEGRQCS